MVNLYLRHVWLPCIPLMIKIKALRMNWCASKLCEVWLKLAIYLKLHVFKFGTQYAKTAIT